MKRFILIILLVLGFFTSIGHAEISKEKRAEIERTLQLTGMEGMMNQMKTNLLSILKSSAPRLKEAYWTKLEARMDMKELIEQMMPLYDKYYTLEDLKVLNAFYESPTGKKLVATMPQLMQEGTKVGQAWGAKIAAEVDEASKRPDPDAPSNEK